MSDWDYTRTADLARADMYARDAECDARRKAIEECITIVKRAEETASWSTIATDVAIERMRELLKNL